MSSIFNEDEETALALVFASRLITRKPIGLEEVQTGFGRKDEFYKALVWMHNNRPQLLYRNLHLIPVFGSWKDFLTEPLIDVLDAASVYELFSQNLENQLLLKYLPQIRSKSKVRTERDKKRSQWAFGLASYLGVFPREYRKLKSSGCAHVFQRQMSQNEWEKINFNGIPGKAMTLMTSRHGKDGKDVFDRHNLVEKLVAWVNTQKDVKFNGYPHELTKAAVKAKGKVQKLIFDKQFENLLGKFGEHKLGNVLCALDTSASMTWEEVAPGVRPLDVCLSLGMVFSSLNTGYFKNYVVSFNNVSTLVKLTGGFTERLQQTSSICSGGSTNFQSVIDLLVKTRKDHPDIPLSEYPETILVVSDMQFNICGNNTKTNYEGARQKLNDAGLPEVRIIWWWCTGTPTDFPSSLDDKGVYMVGGFDPVVLKALLGLNSTVTEFKAKEKVEETPMDGMKNLLSQPIFNLLQTGL